MEHNSGFARPSIDDDKIPIFIFSNAFDYLHYKEVNRENGFPYYQFMQCTKGSGTLWIYNEKYKINKGDAFLLPKNIPHRYIKDSDIWLLDWIVLSGSCLDEIFKNLELPQFSIYKNSFSPEIHHMIQDTVKLYQQKPVNRVLLSSSKAYDILLKIKNLSYIKNPLSSVIEYIYNNLTSEITLENLSDVLGITPEYLCRIFKATFNMRPFEYIRKERIQLAKQLLMEKHSVSETAHMSGFVNENYFREAFKKETGISPREYRNNF